MAEIGHQHRRAETDPGCALGDQSEMNPDVLVERGGVVEPHALEAEILGEEGEIGRAGLRR